MPVAAGRGVDHGSVALRPLPVGARTSKRCLTGNRRGTRWNCMAAAGAGVANSKGTRRLVDGLGLFILGLGTARLVAPGADGIRMCGAGRRSLWL